jgi:hypothetical protein
MLSKPVATGAAGPEPGEDGHRQEVPDPPRHAGPTVSSVQPLAMTIMSISPGSAPFVSCSRRRQITRPSLCAGITTVVTTQHYQRRRRLRRAI